MFVRGITVLDFGGFREIIFIDHLFGEFLKTYT
jgi:hypothetical protein